MAIELGEIYRTLRQIDDIAQALKKENDELRLENAKLKKELEDK